MKRLALVTATTLLGACATAPTAPTTTANAETTNAYGREVDARQVNAINRVARVNGVDVHWLNYPEAKSSSGNGQPTPTGT